MVLDILTPSEKLADALEVSAVFLPGTCGEFEVLKGHAPIVSTLESGLLRYRTASGETEIRINSGFVRVSGDHICACVEK